MDAWPKDAASETDYDLLSHLTRNLHAALADATDDGVENEDHYTASDRDVPSVAQHKQNRYRSGFQAIVRVIEVWLRLQGSLLRKRSLSFSNGATLVFDLCDVWHCLLALSRLSLLSLLLRS
jgi:hypothetical protein